MRELTKQQLAPPSYMNNTSKQNGSDIIDAVSQPPVSAAAPAAVQNVSSFVALLVPI